MIEYDGLTYGYSSDFDSDSMNFLPHVDAFIPYNIKFSEYLIDNFVLSDSSKSIKTHYTYLEEEEITPKMVLDSILFLKKIMRIFKIKKESLNYISKK